MKPRYFLLSPANPSRLAAEQVRPAGLRSLRSLRASLAAASREVFVSLLHTDVLTLEDAGDTFKAPLLRDARGLQADAEVVLLGSIASTKYVELLIGVFRARLLFPREFVGRGDMSRGGLMLRSAEDGVELDYIPVEGAVRRGARPPKLEPRKRK